MNIDIYNDDCLNNKIPDNSIDLGIFDPPFGLGESSFDKHYKRNSKYVIQGYQEAPKDYEQWTMRWLSEAKRILKDNGSMYVFMGHTNLRYLLNAANVLELNEINHLIWKYNFGVYTKKKFVTCHYHILYYSKSPKAKVTFNTNCRYGMQEKNDKGGSLVYSDLEDVFAINRDYLPKEKKNQNKLPEELINKLILYSSNPNDVVCDFFLGNFTTAYCALRLGRKICGYEINEDSFDYHMNKITDIEFGEGIKNLRKVQNIVPVNQGKPITSEEIKSICNDYCVMLKNGDKKKNISLFLQNKYGRGRFAIKNILDKNYANSNH